MPKRRKSKSREETSTKKIIAQVSSETSFEALFKAIEKNDIELTKKIIEQEKIDVNSHDKNGNTVLHFAAEQNNLELLKLFVDKYNGNINTVDQNNWSVLHSVASGIINEKEDWSIIEWMLENGAKTDLQTIDGFTIEDIFLQKDWSYAEKYKEIVANFTKEKESSATEMELEAIRTQIEVSPSS